STVQQRSGANAPALRLSATPSALSYWRLRCSATAISSSRNCDDLSKGSPSSPYLWNAVVRKVEYAMQPRAVLLILLLLILVAVSGLWLWDRLIEGSAPAPVATATMPPAR